MGIRHWGWGVRVSSKLHCARLCSIYWPPWPLTRFNGWDFNTVTGAWLIMGWELVYRGRGKKHLNYKCIAAPLYFSEIWIGNIVHGGNPLYGVEDCFRHSRGLEWSIWTKCFACGIFYVYDGQPQKLLFIFLYSDPLKKVVLSEVGAFPKLLHVQHFCHAFFAPFAVLSQSLEDE